MVLYCFKCHQEVVFDAEHIGKNGRKIPLDPTTRRPHDCPEREKPRFEDDIKAVSNHPWAREQEDKDDHGNEQEGISFAVANQGAHLVKAEYVDHTAKGQSKVRIFWSDLSSQTELEYNEFLKTNNGKIKTQGAQFQINQDSEGIVFAIALYYEEIKQ